MANITGTSSQLPIGILTSLLAFNIILSFTASLGNVLILLTIYKVSSLHPVTKLLFASLATTDLCVGLFSQPLFVASIILKIDLANTDLDILYHLREVIYISSYVLCGVSLLISAAISVDRLLVLLLRLRYREVVTQKRAQVVILLCWVIAISCGLVRVWSPTVSKIVVFVACFVSLVTSVICYAKIHQRLQRNQATREDNYGCEQSNEGEEVGGGEEGTGLTTGEGRAAGEEAEATTRAGRDTEEEAEATTGAGRDTEEEAEATTGAGRDTEEEAEATTGAGRDTEEEAEATTGAGRDSEEEAGEEVEGTGRATDEGSERGRKAKVSPKRRIRERVRLNIVQYKKVVSSIFWLQLTLVACYAPFIIVSLLRHTVLSGTTIQGLWLFTATLVYSNSSLNPFLYCWKIREVRMAVKNTAKAFCCRL
nr:tyramine receptor Ser-2-like [Pocillopora verrucosa]